MSSHVAPEPGERSVDASGGPRTVALDDDREIAYASYGDPGGDPVVFLHETPGSRRLAELLETAAADRGLRILALDRPGYGESAPWSEYTLADAPGVLAAVDAGYYEVPRTGAIEDVADELDCATSTAGELLGKAESAVVSSHPG